jgi:Zeta toxin
MRRWQERAAGFLRAGRYHTLLESGFRDPEAVLGSAVHFAQAGYVVRVCVLAVPAVLSRLGIIERYARQVEVAGAGRWTTAASHDADYAGTVQVLQLAAASPAVTRVCVLIRDGLVFDDHRDPSGAWRLGGSAVEVLAEARDMPLSRLQRVALGNRLTSTLERLRRAGLAHPALDEMAAEVARELVRLAPELPQALGHLREPATVLDAGIGRSLTAVVIATWRPGEPPGVSLEL